MRFDQKRLARRSSLIATGGPRPQRAISRLHARLYRISGGRVLPRWFAGAPVMVLETVGRRSGRIRRTPVLYLRHGHALVVLAANAGSERTPAWWLNLRDAGEGTVIAGRHRATVQPRVAAGAEREQLSRPFVEIYPQADPHT